MKRQWIFNIVIGVLLDVLNLPSRPIHVLAVCRVVLTPDPAYIMPGEESPLQAIIGACRYSDEVHCADCVLPDIGQ